MAATRLATRSDGSRPGSPAPSASKVSDGELVTAFQDGDRRAFDALYERYYPQIVVFYRKRIRTPHAAEDYAHDVFVKALARLDGFDPNRPMWPWLHTIARNRLIDQYRTSNHEADLPDDALPDVDHSFDEYATSMAERQLLSQAIDRLPLRERTALTLKYCDEFDTSQLQESFGIGRSALYKLLQRARDQLRVAYEDLTGSKLSGLLPAPLVGRLHRLVERIRARSTGLEASLLAAPNCFEAVASAATAVAIGIGLATAAAAHGPPDVAIDEQVEMASTTAGPPTGITGADIDSATFEPPADPATRPAGSDRTGHASGHRTSVAAGVSSSEAASESPGTFDATVESGADEGETIEVSDEIDVGTEMDDPIDELELIEHDYEMTIYCEPTAAGRAVCAAYHAADRELPDDLPGP